MLSRAVVCVAITAAAAVTVSKAVTLTDEYEVKADPNPTYLTTDTYKDQASAMLVAQSDEEFFGVWESNEGGFPQIFGQRLQTSDSAYIGGRKRLSIEGLPSAQPFIVSLKRSKRMAVVYIEVLTRVVVRLFDLDGKPVSRPIVIDSGAAVKFAPTLATVACGLLGRERAMVVWSQGDSGLNPQSFGRLLNLDSLDIGELIEVRESQTRDPRVTAVQSDRFLLTYTSDSLRGSADDFNVMGRLFDEEGEQASDEFMVNIDTCGKQASPQTIAIGQGYFVTVWSDAERGALYGRVFDKYAHKCGQEFKVDSVTVRPYLFNVRSDGNDRVFGVAYAKASATDNGVAVTNCADGETSKESSDVMAALFSFSIAADTCSAYESASQIGDAFVVSAASTTDGCDADSQKPTDGVQLTDDGRFAVAMTGNDFDQSGFGVRAQLFTLESSDSNDTLDDTADDTAMQYRLMRAEKALQSAFEH